MCYSKNRELKITLLFVNTCIIVNKECQHIVVSKVRIVVNKNWRVYLVFGRTGNLSLQL